MLRAKKKKSYSCPYVKTEEYCAKVLRHLLCFKNIFYVNGGKVQVFSETCIYTQKYRIKGKNRDGQFKQILKSICSITNPPYSLKDLRKAFQDLEKKSAVLFSVVLKSTADNLIFKLLVLLVVEVVVRLLWEITKLT